MDPDKPEDANDDPPIDAADADGVEQADGLETPADRGDALPAQEADDAEADTEADIDLSADDLVDVQAAPEPPPPGELTEDLSALADAIDHKPAPRLPYGNDNRLLTAHRCIECHFILYTLPVDGVCPECGRPVRESIRGNQLKDSDVEWLKSVRSGLGWMALAVFIGALMFALAYFAEVTSLLEALGFDTSPVSTGGVSTPPLAVRMINLSIILLPALAYITAMIDLTAPERWARKTYRSRAAARWTLIPGYALMIIMAGLFTVPEPILLMIGAICAIAAAVLLPIGYISLLLYLHTLARRVPAKPLARQTLMLLFALIGWHIALFALTLFAGIAENMGTSVGGTIFHSRVGLVGMIATLFKIFFAVWWIFLLNAFRDRLSRAIASIYRGD